LLPPELDSDLWWKRVSADNPAAWLVAD